MATISIDVTAAVASRVAAAFIETYPPPAGVPVGTAAEKLAYVKSHLVTHLREVVRAHEVRVAAAAASEAASAKANAEVTPT